MDNSVEQRCGRRRGTYNIHIMIINNIIYEVIYTTSVPVYTYIPTTYRYIRSKGQCTYYSSTVNAYTNDW